MTRKKLQKNDLDSLQRLVFAIQRTNDHFLNKVQKQVNTALTLRNWMIGYYIFEYEQNGKDRAAYGQKLYKELAENLKSNGVKSLSERNLYLCKDFYLAYPGIVQTASAESYLIDFESDEILQTLSAKFGSSTKSSTSPTSNPTNVLLSQLSFSHFIELIKTDDPLKREFYEVQTIKNNWGVRDLKRAINSMLFERTGLSSDKKLTLENYSKDTNLKPEDVFRNPYLLEFLGLEEKPSYSESDLEQAIINHLQSFLLEMGKGFCFEARQKRITFDNTHYRIDLVFYHRILKCHVLVDLKLGEFSHADAGQMNLYLNYYKENEMHKDDAPPVGIILCAGKNETLVKYAITGLPQKVFVSKYMISLPSEKELKQIIKEEQKKQEQHLP
jgi:predicted nuclease of restriction endonuclease-like (RecB) superfamily